MSSHVNVLFLQLLQSKGRMAPAVIAKHFGGFCYVKHHPSLIMGQWNHRCSCTMTKINVVPTWLILKPPTVIKAVFQMSIKKGFCNHYKWRSCIAWERKCWDRWKEKHPSFLTQLLPHTRQPPCAETSPAHTRAKAPQKRHVGGHRSMAHLKKQILQRVSKQIANKRTSGVSAWFFKIPTAEVDNRGGVSDVC